MDWQKRLTLEKKKWAKISADDKAAKQAGKNINRLIQIPVADGYASYIIVEEDASQVRLKHVKLGDAYMDWNLGGGGWFNKKNILKQLKMVDSWNAMFDKAKTGVGI